MNYKDDKGKPYSPVYLKTVHNQLSAIFNHAVRYYNLRDNPCKKAGSMGKKKNRVTVLESDLTAIALAMRLNVRASKLMNEYGIRYENSRTHAGRTITLTLANREA